MQLKLGRVDNALSSIEDLNKIYEPLDEDKLKDIHGLLMPDILLGGIYRPVEFVKIHPFEDGNGSSEYFRSM